MSDQISMDDLDHEHNEMSCFAKYLIETGHECADQQPDVFCLVAIGKQSGIRLFGSFPQIGDESCSAQVLAFIGALDKIKADALSVIQMHYEGDKQ